MLGALVDLHRGFCWCVRPGTEHGWLPCSEEGFVLCSSAAVRDAHKPPSRQALDTLLRVTLALLPAGLRGQGRHLGTIFRGQPLTPTAQGCTGSARRAPLSCSSCDST